MKVIDKVRAMSDEELAELFSFLSWRKDFIGVSKETVLKWLYDEYEEGK